MNKYISVNSVMESNLNNAFKYIKAIVSLIWMYLFGARGEFRELKKKTAIVLHDVIPKDACVEMIERINKIVDDESHSRVWRDNTASDCRILGFEKDIPEFFSLFEVRRRISAVDAYTGRKTRSWFLMANRVVPKENNLGSGGGLHRDSPFSHQVKCIWYLSNVTNENGPFQYIPGSNFRLLEMRAHYPLGESRFKCVAHDLTEVVADAGSLLVCDTKCIHGGKPIQKGARYAVTLYTFPTENGAERVFSSSGVDPSFVRKQESEKPLKCT